ncbi:hypothetical protein [Glutamicibacter protophormiae]|uniref:DUF8175 domain-containing protein n=1 Tax=Glutamicibacter protophormiae TaxID=37930 RepID=A0ABS4XVX6_GLUPR|nr:hypothetical protein [Glutamicibacter protophormiae]MBP2400490.1 hypothetical protein [Glutamicibacter protophormiae]GGM01228.1 hypothetical protein GCM10010038_34080 [Glutamicibacter protophormiae]
MAETDPLGKNWKLWGGILAFIAAVVILGLIFFPRTPPQPEATPTAPAPSVPVDTAPPSASPSASVSKLASGDCPALSTDTSFPNDAPDTEWKRHPAGMLLPVSAEHGPAKMDGEFWRCFSHTPSGAVFAGLTLLLDISGAGIIDAAAESPQRDELFEQWMSLEQTSEYPVISGYRIMNSSDDAASVEYIGPAGNQYVSTRVDLLWDDKANDWRLDLSSGEPAWDVTTDPSSYTDLK